MYKIIRPLIFKFSPETMHHIIIGALKIVGYIPGGTWVLRQLFSVKDESLEREVLGIKFPNPIGLAAGFDKNAEVYKELGALGFGFIEIGTVTPKAQPGNPKPRIFRLPADNAIINRMGFNNFGLNQAVDRLRNRGNMIIGGNLGKNTLTTNEDAAADYLKCFRSLYEYVDYFVINVSCPNVKSLGALQQKDNLVEILDGLFAFRRGQNNYRPILLKISPDLTWEQLDDIIEILKETSLDGIVAANTTTSRSDLLTSKDSVEAIGNGGLSGQPLTDRSIQMIKYINEKTDGSYPIIGVGGIMTPRDAKNMLDAGASLVQIYSGMIYEGPGLVKKILKLLKEE